MIPMHPRAWIGLAAMVSAYACLPAVEAQAAEARYALVIGVNDGSPDDERLLYAEHDATRMADVLTRLGGVAAENLILLKGGTASSVDSALDALGARVAARARGAAPIVFIYYSGHADARALHLRGTRLSFSRLKARVRDVGADVSVFVVDACRSGGLTRVKGAVPAEAFEITATDTLMSEGVAIITSSAEGEDAQESERLKGGIFTHHLISGLLGAADATGDERVTLGEAYRYAYSQTLRATTRTRFVQHPTYAFRMKGKRELVLTRLAKAASLGRVRLVQPGHYVLIERSGQGGVTAELEVERDTELMVAPGRYLVRRRDAAAIYEGDVRVVAGTRAMVDDDTLQRVPYRQTVRRGYAGVTPNAWSLGGSFALSGPLLDGTGLALFGAVGAQIDLKDVALQLRLRYGHSSDTNQTLTLAQDLFGLDFGVLKLFDVADTPLALGLGLRTGLDWLSQRFDSRGTAPDRDLFVGRVGAFARAELALSSVLSMQLDCGADVYLLDARNADGTTGFETPVAPFCALGFGVMVP